MPIPLGLPERLGEAKNRRRSARDADLNNGRRVVEALAAAGLSAETRQWVALL